jgi:hypothetical protein
LINVWPLNGWQIQSELISVNKNVCIKKLDWQIHNITGKDWNPFVLKQYYWYGKPSHTIFYNLSNKLKNESLSSKEWWKTLKSLISSTNNSSIPPVTDPLNRNIIYTNNDKVNLLNNFFVEQMSINDENRDPL